MVLLSLIPLRLLINHLNCHNAIVLDQFIKLPFNLLLLCLLHDLAQKTFPKRSFTKFATLLFKESDVKLLIQ